ncbi:hypothetical protein ON010_g12917 [Phytophthora cinnamomi]|nr:hypothetical protein ON010_g12917 [Phytophthora cinnamomi]
MHLPATSADQFVAHPEWTTPASPQQLMAGRHRSSRRTNSTPCLAAEPHQHEPPGRRRPAPPAAGCCTWRTPGACGARTRRTGTTSSPST